MTYLEAMVALTDLVVDHNETDVLLLLHSFHEKVEAGWAEKSIMDHHLYDTYWNWVPQDALEAAYVAVTQATDKMRMYLAGVTVYGDKI